jgi:myo-inositol-1(or 4)-monophosphatase
MRQTGSAAVECAFVAAGLLRVSRFLSPNIWDVAAGLCLVRAARGAILMHKDGVWTEMTRFEPMIRDPGDEPSLRRWRRHLLVGDAHSAGILAAALG